MTTYKIFTHLYIYILYDIHINCIVCSRYDYLTYKPAIICVIIYCRLLSVAIVVSCYIVFFYQYGCT